MSRNDIHRSYRWRQLRKSVLAETPLCAACGRVATDVDHRVPLFKGGEPFDRANLQALCRRCHKRKSAGEQSKAPRICVHGWPGNLEEPCPDCEAEPKAAEGGGEARNPFNGAAL